MTSISQNATSLQNWFTKQQASPQQAKQSTITQAAKDLGLSVGDVHAARRELVEQAAQQQTPVGANVTGRGAVNAGFGGGNVAQSAGVVARGNATDPRISAFEKSTYTLLDVQEVAKKLSLTPEQAKKHIGEKIQTGKEADLHAIGVHADNFDSYELRDAFARSPYTNADAEAALKAFGFLSNLNDAKEYIGLKVVNGPAMEAQVLAPLGITRNNFDDHDCYAAFKRSTYSDADVDAARKAFPFLKGSSTKEVQEYIGLKIVNKYEKMLSDVGITPANFDRQDCLAAFAKSTYSAADVKKAEQTFDFLKGLPAVEVKEYIGLKIVNGYEKMLADVGITQQAWDPQDLKKAFDNSGYDKADVAKAKKAFDFLQGDTDEQVKQYIGLKIVNNYEQMLKDVGITPNKKPSSTSN